MENSSEIEVYEENNQYNDIQPSEEISLMGRILEWVELFVISLSLVIFIFTMVIGKVEVSGNSMNNTLQNGDQLIVASWKINPKVGDIVILAKKCSETDKGHQYDDSPLVKRVVALEGQTVEIKQCKLFVDGVEVEEKYAFGNTYSNGFEGVQTVPQGKVFVIGDNREDSADSRIIGFVDKNYIIGKVLFRMLPFKEIENYN